MSTSKEVATTEKAGLPALAPTPALAALGSDAYALPRLYKAESQGNAFKEELVPKGCLFIASGGDDPNPEVIWTQGDEQGVLVHILDVWQRKSANLDGAGNVVKSGGEFTTWAMDDPDAPAEANVDYHYAIVLPEVDPDIPVKVTLAKTSVPTAKRINFLLLKNEGAGQPIHNLAFRFTCKERKSEKGGTKYQWYVWQATQVDADAGNIEAAAKAAQLVTPAAKNDIEQSAPASDQPGI